MDMIRGDIPWENAYERSSNRYPHDHVGFGGYNMPVKWPSHSRGVWIPCHGRDQPILLLLPFSLSPITRLDCSAESILRFSLIWSTWRGGEMKNVQWRGRDPSSSGPGRGDDPTSAKDMDESPGREITLGSWRREWRRERRSWRWRCEVQDRGVGSAIVPQLCWYNCYKKHHLAHHHWTFEV